MFLRCFFFFFFLLLSVGKIRYIFGEKDPDPEKTLNKETKEGNDSGITYYK